ncbi:MAG TPA: hypothetical protein V6D00_06920 [Pantanalinema sp.]
MTLDDAEVILHLHIRIRQEHHAAFAAYVQDAFPVFEASGACKGAVYVSATDPEVFDEVFYYRDEAAYRAGEAALTSDPAQAALLKRWRELLEGPPRVEVFRRSPLDASRGRTGDI